MPFLHEVTVWHWWTLGIIFLIIELIGPGACFLWLAISSGVIGIIVWVIPALSIIYQLILFSVLAVTSIVLYLRFRSIPQNSQTLNQRAKQHIGHIFILENDLENGQGKIQLGDTLWSIKGTNCNKGTKVKVVTCEESILHIEVYK